MGVINNGTTPNDGTGNSIRDGGEKINNAFANYVAGQIPPQTITEPLLNTNSVSTRTIIANNVTNAKLAQMAQATIKGRASGAGTGDPQDLTAAQARTILSVQQTDAPAFTTSLALSRVSGTVLMTVSGAAGNERSFQFLTGANARFEALINGDAESSTDVGSNFRLRRVLDSGTKADVMSVARSTGIIGLANSRYTFDPAAVGTTTFLRNDGAWAAPLVSDVQIFTATGAGTWTKPGGLTGNELVLVLMWSGGGGGSSVASAAGGGGGVFIQGLFRAADLNATESLSVGAGGAIGTVGGNSTFKNLTAFGGGPGVSGTGGGQGGGVFAAGAAGGSSSVPGAGGVAGISAGAAGGNSVDGGGGGGVTTGAGGNSLRGGGGGSGSGSGGTSGMGGNGGAGGAAGIAPGGGGGANAAGARGEIRVIVLR